MTNWTYALIPGWGEVCFQQITRERDTDRLMWLNKLTAIKVSPHGVTFMRHPLYAAGLIHDPVHIDPAFVAMRSVCQEPATAKLNECWSDIVVPAPRDRIEITNDGSPGNHGGLRLYYDPNSGAHK